MAQIKPDRHRVFRMDGCRLQRRSQGIPKAHSCGAHFGQLVDGWPQTEACSTCYPMVHPTIIQPGMGSWRTTNSLRPKTGLLRQLTRHKDSIAPIPQAFSSHLRAWRHPPRKSCTSGDTWTSRAYENCGRLSHNSLTNFQNGNCVHWHRQAFGTAESFIPKDHPPRFQTTP